MALHIATRQKRQSFAQIENQSINSDWSEASVIDEFFFFIFVIAELGPFAAVGA